MGLIIKPLQLGEKSSNRWKIHKEHKVVMTNSSSHGLEVYMAEYQTGSINSFSTASSDPTYNSKYRNIIHHSMNTQFYRGYVNEPARTLAVPARLSEQQKRVLDRKAVVISVPQKKYGEKIYEGTFQLTGSNNVMIQDDKLGNLIDPSISTTHTIPSGSELLHLAFNEGHEFTGQTSIGSAARFREEFQTKVSGCGRPYITNFPLDDRSGNRSKVFGYHIQFDERTGSFEHGKTGFGTHLVLPGINPFFSTSIQQSDTAQINKRGQTSYLNVSSHGDYRFNPHEKFQGDFSIAFWINLPVSQSVTSSLKGREADSKQYATSTFNHNTNFIIGKCHSEFRKGPFIIETYNHTKTTNTPTEGLDNGKIVWKRGSDDQTEHDYIHSGSVGGSELTSSTSINDNDWHHVVCQHISGNNEIYIDGTLEASLGDTAFTEGDAPIYKPTPVQIGGHTRGYLTASAEPELNNFQQPAYNWYNWDIQRNSPKNIVQPLQGRLDEIRIYDKSLSFEEIRFLSESNNTNQVGNIFYQHGFAVVTAPHDKYQNMMTDNFNDTDANDFELQYSACTQLQEREYVLNVKSHEMDGSTNITLRKNHDPDEIEMKDFITSSAFSPYITKLGLYNDQLELLAIAQLGQPIKKPKDVDITFIVRMDML